MITVIKNTIIEHLKSLADTDENFEGFDVEEFPDKFEGFNFISAKGCLLVRDDGSTFSRSETIEKIVQSETVRVSVLIALRYLEKSSEQDTFVKRVINELRGVQILTKRLYPTKREYLGRLDTDCWHGVQFEITLPSQSGTHNIAPIFEAG
jgi:hypothetical protein